MKTLILIGIGILFAGATYAVLLKQIQAYASQQTYLAIQATLPHHNTNKQKEVSSHTQQITEWKSYHNNTYGFDFKYPATWGEVVFNKTNVADWNLENSAKCINKGYLADWTFTNSSNGISGSSKDFSQCGGRTGGAQDYVKILRVDDKQIVFKNNFGGNTNDIAIPIKSILTSGNKHFPIYNLDAWASQPNLVIKLPNNKDLDFLEILSDENSLAWLNTFNFTN